MSSLEQSWRGVPISEIIGSQSPWGAPEFPLITPGHNHAVLYHISRNGSEGDRPPKPQIGAEKWDHDFVRLPCSSHSLYPVENENGDTHLIKRWTLIEAALWKPIKNSHDLADAIVSYNTKFKNIWRFRTLHRFFNEYLEEEESQYFFDVTLPEIAKLALALPKLIQAPIPLLRQNRNRSVSMSQQQISSLLANAFFCTFPRRNTNKKSSEYATFPHINFNVAVPLGLLTFGRRCVASAACPRWAACEARLGALPLHVDSAATIEELHGLIQLDFANKFLGGGVLGQGCVQEEIRFAICPELVVSMLLAEAMTPNEAVIIIGCEQFSSYRGYGREFCWAGAHADRVPLDSSGRRRCAVLAVDALPYASLQQQFRRSHVERELTKAWVGFSFFAEAEGCGAQLPGLATGNWGCGAFGGSPALKSLLQLMAAAAVRRPVAYCTFGDRALRDELAATHAALVRRHVSVGELHAYLMLFATTDVRRNNLHSFILQRLKDEPRNETVAATLPPSEPSRTPDKFEITLTDSMHEEFADHSPELFSPDESEPNINQKKTDLKESDATGEFVFKMADSENKMASDQTSRLFDEMQKIDNQSGMSCSVNNSYKFSPIKQNVNTSMDDQPDVAVEVKKKITAKITDYFSKKPL